MKFNFSNIESDIQNIKTILVSLNDTMQQINAIILLDNIKDASNTLPIYKPQTILESIKIEYENLSKGLMETMIDIVEGRVFDKYGTHVPYLSYSVDNIFYNNELVYQFDINNIDDFTADNITNSYINIIKPELNLRNENVKLIHQEMNELIDNGIIKYAIIDMDYLHNISVGIEFNDFTTHTDLRMDSYFYGQLAGFVKNSKAIHGRFRPERLINKEHIGHRSNIKFVPGKLDLHTGKFGADTIYNDIVKHEIKKAIDIISYNYFYQLNCICTEDYIINNDCYYRQIKSFSDGGIVYTIYAVRYAGMRAKLKLFNDKNECITGRKYRKLMKDRLSKEEIIALANFL